MGWKSYLKNTYLRCYFSARRTQNALQLSLFKARNEIRVFGIFHVRCFFVVGFVFFLLLCSGSSVFAVESAGSLDSVQEAQLFENAEPVKQELQAQVEKESVGFSGQLQSRNWYAMTRDWLSGHGTGAKNSLTSLTQGNLFLDVRLKKGIKAFANVEIQDYSTKVTSGTSSLSTLFAVKELFIDFNANQAAYVRVGKQLVQWGRTFFWNPTDLVNIEKRSFLDLNRQREGTYGTRIHLPFGAEKNLYFFVSNQQATNLDQLALSSKYEWVTDKTEMSVSFWAKPYKPMVVGYDVSSRFLDLDLACETTLQFADSKPKFELKNGLASEYRYSGIIPRVAVNATKTFDANYKEQISYTTEIFYNGLGYSSNVFANPVLAQNLVSSGQIESMYHSQWYAAQFLSVSKFPISDTTLSLNSIFNLNDGSFIVSPALNWAIIDHLSVGTAVSFFGGPKDAEFTYSGSGILTELSLTAQF